MTAMAQGGSSWMDEVGTPASRNMTLEGRMAAFEISGPHSPRDVRSQSFPEQGRARDSAFSSMFNDQSQNLMNRRMPQTSQTSVPGAQWAGSFQTRSPEMGFQMPQPGPRSGMLSRPLDTTSTSFGDMGARRNLRAEAEFMPRESLYAVVEFKLFRAEVYQYPTSLERDINVGCLVLVEADRGTDLGFVAHLSRSSQEAIKFKRTSNKKHLNALMKDSATARQLMESGRISKVPRPGSDSIFDDLNLFVSNDSFSHPPRNIIRLAEQSDQQHLLVKEGYEAKAKRVCAQKATDFGLQMEILDAEAQIDGNKLTFYYYSDGYVTFNPLVQDLFKEFKTRIWLSAVNPASCYPQASYNSPTTAPVAWNAYNNPQTNVPLNAGQSPPTTAGALQNPPSPWNTSRYRRSTDIIGAQHVPPHLQPAQSTFTSGSSSATSSPGSHRRSSSWNSANMPVGTPSPTSQPRTLASNVSMPNEPAVPGQNPGTESWQHMGSLGNPSAWATSGGKSSPLNASQVVSFYDFTNQGVSRYSVHPEENTIDETPGEAAA